MKTLLRNLMAILATVAFGSLLVPMASAGCANANNGVKVAPQSWNGQSSFGSAALLLASNHDSDVSIVGVWHVAFIAKGNVGPGLPPDGALVDNSFSQWHSDGTEVQVSSRAPQTGDVCMGVWEKVGEWHYKLNHFGISFDPTTDPNNPQGFADIRQDIFLNPDGITFKGSFTIQQYDQSGNLLIEIKGLLHGYRVNQHTTVGDLLSQS
jgi:hypothetical protein